jgi:NADH:ubiquinone oxidoreductase subunit E
MKINVCFGSSCHIKGAGSVYEMLLQALKENHLEEKVQVGGTLCLGHCKEPGVNLTLDGEVVTGVTKDTFQEFFDTRVKKPLLG